ncbi:AAA family ATPase [Brevibacillus ruminantium]|uniref:AAA family ATPase n=1 Tax=Brevibacillus ruminantium TaxID=2950604 RepID=A0ABY4WF55_9BACL|nr:AAA family ATPase [Brevibacillus ruminantium]USG65692.1 AAA family ATPase [Brevibacillus ruminantium]
MEIQKQSIMKAIKFLFPETQLFSLVRQEGFFAKKEPVVKPPKAQKSVKSVQSSQTQKAAGPSDQADNSTFEGSVTAETIKQSTLSTPSSSRQSRKKRNAGNTPQYLIKDATWSAKELDQIFQDAENEVNRYVIGQKPFITDLMAAFKQGFINGRKDKPRNVILLAGAAGTGKKTALDALVTEMFIHKLTASPIVADIDLSRYEEDEISGNFILDMASAFQELEGTVMFRGIKEADSSILSLVSQLVTEGSFRTKEGVRVSASGYFLVFYLDHAVTGGSEYGQIPAELASQVPIPILQGIQAAAISSTVDKETMQQIAKNLLDKALLDLATDTQTTFVVSPRVYEVLAGMATTNKTFGEAVHHWIEKELIAVVSNLRARNEIRRNDKVKIKFENDSFCVETRSIEVPIRALSFARKESVDDVLAELNELTGLESVKMFVKELIKTVQVNKIRARDGGSSVAMALHMVYTGNPGTGKTTVARLIARILKAMELLPQGQLVEVSRQDLVGQYVGSTAPKTMAKVNEALGGVLFIDEAYTLARSDHDTFGLEAIDTIVKAMEDHRDNLVVVLAGYTQEMEGFLRTNPGLRSRFPFIVEFPDYKPADMLEIMLRMANAKGFRIDPDIYDGLTELFDQKQIPGRNDSGNGRLVRNLFEEAVRKQATRLVESSSEEDADLQLLTGADFGIGERAAFNLEGELAGIVGLDKIKAFVRTLEKQMIVDRRRKEAGIQVDTGQMINMIFSGNPGTGKTTMARLLASMFRSMGYLKKGHLVEVDRSDLVAEYSGQTAAKTKQVVESALGGVLFIDEAYALAQDGGGGFGKEAIDMLVRLIELHKNNLVVILAGYTEDMEKFLQVNPGMSSRFPLHIEFPDYTAEEMELISTIMVKARGFTMAEGVAEQLRGYFDKKQIPGKKDVGNGRLVRNTIEEAIRMQAERLADHPEIETDKLNELIAEDFGLSTTGEGASPSVNALGELDTIIGLDAVKDFVRSISAQIEVAKRREELGLPRATAQTLHMVFKGNPGTGKTTIARILARHFKDLGVIKADTLVETDRSGLVAGYVGQTALKTREVIERALGGVLFVDEAYALAEGDQFGQEAIDTLVKAMDDYRDRLIVILAGYDQDMERFLDRNAGLRSRFPNIITFPDYSAEEMLQIAQVLVEKQGYILVPEAEEKLLSLFRSYESDTTAGNGRLVRNMIEKAFRSHALRISKKANATTEELSMLMPEDFEG